MNYDFIPGSQEGMTGTAPPISNFPNFNNNTTNNMTDDYTQLLLALNLNMYAHFYMSFPDSLEWRDRVFSGYIEKSGRDYVLIRSTQDNKWYILWTVYLNYVVFDEDPVKR